MPRTVGRLEALVQRSAAKQAGQKSGDGGIPRSGGAGDALDRERGTPQLAVGPTGQVDRHGSARIGQALGAAGAEVVPAMPALQRRHARPHREEGTGHFGTLGFADVVEQFRTALGLFAGEELLRVHHEKRLFHAGQEDVDVRQNPFENSRPRSLARRAVRIGQSHVQRRGRPRWPWPGGRPRPIPRRRRRRAGASKGDIPSETTGPATPGRNRHRRCRSDHWPPVRAERYGRCPGGRGPRCTRCPHRDR
jgi:hypothetical protein